MEEPNVVMHSSVDTADDETVTRDASEGQVHDTTDNTEGDASAGLGTGTGTERLPFHKDPDIQAYIERQIENRISAYEQKEKERSLKNHPQEDPDLQELIELGFGKTEARRTLAIIDARAERRISPIQSQQREKQIEQIFKEFTSTHKDISEEVWGEMNAITEKLTKEQQSILLQNPLSLEMFYAMAKTNLGLDYNKGKQDGVINARRKKEGGNMSGSPAGSSELTEESINNMSTEEFNKREKEIMKKLRQVSSEEED